MSSSFISLQVKKHQEPLFRSPVVRCHRTGRRRGAQPWLFSPPSVTPERKKKLFFSAASRFFPTTPPPTRPQTPPSSLLRLLPSWPSCAPGAASTSSSCLMWGPRTMPWILAGHRACLTPGCLLPAQEWTVWVPWLWTRWRCDHTKPSLSNCSRQEATHRDVWRASPDFFFPDRMTSVWDFSLSFY